MSETLWSHATTHVVESEVIIAQGPKQQYNPWEYCRDIPEKAVHELFDKKRAQPIALHAAFASIDPDNVQQIVLWCNHFGFPVNRSDDRYSLSDFKTRLNIFRVIFSSTNILRRGSKERLAQFLIFLKENYGKKYAIGGTVESIKNNPYPAANEYIASSLNDGLRQDFWPVFQVSNEKDIKFSWRASSLDSIMRFMVGQEIADGNLPIRCMNRTCSVYFVPRNERNMYCSEQCKNQVQQRRLQSFRREQRVMEALKACQSGTSVKEAAVQYKLTLPYLQKRLLFAAEKHSRP